MTDSLRSLHGALAVEVDLKRLPEDGRYYRGLWSREDAARLVELIGADLAGWFPEVSQAGLVVTAASHGFASLLRPGLPALSTQAALYAGSQSTGFQAGQLAIGCDSSGELPDRRLHPVGEFSPLLLLPWSLLGPAERIGPLADDMERQLGELGAAQPPTLHPLEQILQLPVTHAGYLTLNDACALASLQYQQIGCDSLWPLIDAVVFTPQQRVIEQIHGQPAMAEGGKVWLGFAPPEAFAGDRDRWLAWLSRFRQYQQALELHGIEVEPTDAGQWPLGCQQLPKSLPSGWVAYQNGQPLDLTALPENLVPEFDPQLGLVSASAGEITVYPLSAEGASQLR